RISYAPLKAVHIGGSIIPTLIDELPVLAVLAAQAEGTTYIRDAAELRVKESDRIAQIVQNLRALGIEVLELPDGMIIHGNAGKPFCSAVIDPHGDHRLAMAFAVAGLASEGGVTLTDEACAAVSYPSFFRDLAALGSRQ
ncbi:MAG: 3-phosphoshikimate 1-carboxyvinyltransferase, partial [bacterium]